MQEDFSGFLGNDALRRRLGLLCRNGRLPHAFLLEGEKGSGRRTLARMIAAANSCEKKETAGSSLPCMTCPVCRKIMDGFCPDVIAVERPEDKAQIGVELIREMRSDMYITPNELSRKYYIVNEAEIMTAQAQNALLKNLEEPPGDATVFLICTKASLLLETVRSRVQILRMEKLSDTVIREWLVRTDSRAARLPQEKLAQIAVSAAGAPGSALHLLEQEAFSEDSRNREDALRLARICASGSFDADAIACIRSLPQKREELSRVFSLAYQALRDLAVSRKYADAPLVFFTGSCREEASQYSMNRLTSAMDRIGRAQSALTANASVPTLLLSLVCGQL